MGLQKLFMHFWNTFRLPFCHGITYTYDFEHSATLKTMPLWILNENLLQSTQKNPYSTVLISVLLYIYFKLQHFSCRTEEKCHILTAKQPIFSAYLWGCRILGLWFFKLCDPKVPQVGLVQLSPLLSSWEEGPLRTCHQRRQVTAFKLNNRVGFFTLLYFVRQNTSMCRLSLWEQLYFHPLCTHLTWA